MKFYTISILLFWVLSIVPNVSMAQKEGTAKEDLYKFTLETVVKHTPVKDQARSGTCWSFGTTSLFESELIRLGKEEFDLSEMFVVRQVYSKKALNYIRYHGRTNFGEGSMPYDWMLVVKENGIVPEWVYNGRNIGEEKHNHGEVARLIEAMLKVLVERPKLTPRWKEAIEAVLDVYLGKLPEKFDYKGKSYTPKTFFQDVLGLNPDDYVEITSFTHHPFYKQCTLEIPDNWARHSHYYNIPMAELEQTIVYALQHGYSVCWDGDVSEKSFMAKEGYAIIPLQDEDKDKDKDEKEAKDVPPEKEITQEMRQETFDNYTTSDDHLMHIVGIAKIPNGTRFFYTKNSWGSKYSAKGFLYLSNSYVKLKTIAILLHKDGVPVEIKAKLGLR